VSLSCVYFCGFKHINLLSCGKFVDVLYFSTIYLSKTCQFCLLFEGSTFISDYDLACLIVKCSNHILISGEYVVSPNVSFRLTLWVRRNMARRVRLGIWRNVIRQIDVVSNKRVFIFSCESVWCTYFMVSGPLRTSTSLPWCFFLKKQLLVNQFYEVLD